MGTRGLLRAAPGEVSVSLKETALWASFPGDILGHLQSVKFPQRQNVSGLDPAIVLLAKKRF